MRFIPRLSAFNSIYHICNHPTTEFLEDARFKLDVF